MDTVTSENETAAYPATALIEVLDTHSRIHSRYRLTSAGSVCKIGRSLSCDIVLDDPFAAAEHTTITLQEDGRIVVHDLGSRNGTRVDERLIGPNDPIAITDGELIVGRTRVRIRTALTALVPEKIFRRDILQRYRTTLTIVGLIACVAYVAFQDWIDFPDPLAPQMVTSILMAIGILCVWTAIWGAVTRFTHGMWTLRTHFAIAANAAALSLWIDWLMGAAIFATEWRWLLGANSVIIGCAVLGALYLHLRKATHFSIRAAIVTSVVLPLTLAGAGLWIAQQGSERDINRVTLGPALYPPGFHVATSGELAEYLTSVDALKREANRKRRQSLADRPLAQSE